MDTGSVKWFNPQDNKRFGFVKLEDGREAFFHYNDGQVVEMTSDGPDLRGPTNMSLKMPLPGERVIGFVINAQRGPKLARWAYAEEYERVATAFANRPAPKQYRVREAMWSTGQDEPEGKVKDQGTVEQISKRFPLPGPGRSASGDPLISYYSHDDGFYIRHTWEAQKEDGSWERCEDPRDLPGVLRTYERINWDQVRRPVARR